MRFHVLSLASILVFSGAISAAAPLPMVGASSSNGALGVGAISSGTNVEPATPGAIKVNLIEKVVFDKGRQESWWKSVPGSIEDFLESAVPNTVKGLISLPGKIVAPL